MPNFDGILILTDLDGTLLGSDTLVSEENRAAARYFMAHGGRLSFATGRSRPGAQHFADIPVNAPAVLNNGSHGYDFAAGQPVYTWDVDKARALALIEDVVSAFPQCGIEVFREDGPWIVRTNALVERHTRYTRVDSRVMAPRDLAGPWISLGILAEPELMLRVADFAQRRFGDVLFIQQSMPHFLEIQRPGAHKGAGALELCRLLGLEPQGLYTIGDGPNDIQLLEATANRFAPQNACPAVRALNPTLLPSNDGHVLPALIEIIEKRG